MKCPICNEPLEIDDVDEKFSGNKDIWGCCNHCHHDFILYIRYHNLWKYDMWDLVYDEKEKQWFSDETTEKTIYVYKGEQK